MAKIGDIVLGGREWGTGVTFELSEPAEFSYLYEPADEPWRVEFRKGFSSIVARTPTALSRSDVLSYGLEQVQRALDIVSFEGRKNLLLNRPSDDHIILFVRDGAYVAQHVGVAPVQVGFDVKIQVNDQDGSIVAPNPQPPVVWTAGLRFYRHSQASTDLYDAYRSLWLGFETLLDSICPPSASERERHWLLRAISHVGSVVDLNSLVPSSVKDAPAYIVGTQYDYIRCRLFHSKPTKVNSTLDLPDPEEVAIAYEALIRIWRATATGCLGVRPGASGAMTHAGFKLMLDNALRDKLTAYFTDDPSPTKKEDTEVSPLGHSVHRFETVTYLSETSPGKVGFLATQNLHKTDSCRVVRRICSKAGDALMTASSIADGLELSGVDYIESYETIRLVNRDLPRTVFGADS